MKKIRIGIVGGAGYTGGELLRLLIHHPQSDIVYIHSRSNAGKPVTAVHADLIGETNWFLRVIWCVILIFSFYVSGMEKPANF
jgi:N-acetyl-gamma-glutamylphosphate reductase